MRTVLKGDPMYGKLLERMYEVEKRTGRMVFMTMPGGRVLTTTTDKKRLDYILRMIEGRSADVSICDQSKSSK